MKIEMTLEEWARLKAGVDELRAQLRELTVESLMDPDSTWSREQLAVSTVSLVRYVDVLESLRDDGAEEVAASLATVPAEVPAVPAEVPAVPPPAVRRVALNIGLSGNPTQKQGF